MCGYNWQNSLFTKINYCEKITEIVFRFGCKLSTQQKKRERCWTIRNWCWRRPETRNVFIFYYHKDVSWWRPWPLHLLLAGKLTGAELLDDIARGTTLWQPVIVDQSLKSQHSDVGWVMVWTLWWTWSIDKTQFHMAVTWRLVEARIAIESRW